MTSAPIPDQLGDAAAWIDDVDGVGDGPEGPIYVSSDGSVVTVPVDV